MDELRACLTADSGQAPGEVLAQSRSLETVRYHTILGKTYVTPRTSLETQYSQYGAVASTVGNPRRMQITNTLEYGERSHPSGTKFPLP